MANKKTSAGETVEQFKARLRRTAMSIPAGVIRRMLANIKSRAQSIYDAKGGNIARD